MIPSTLITIALAEYASRDDFQQIGKGSKIRHGIQWLFRAAVVGLACYLDNCLLYAVPLAFLFSAVFRWRLNELRKLDWRYISPSAWYDWMFLRCCGFYGKSNQMEHWGRSYRTYHGWWRKQVHRAGTLAYIFEAVVFVVGTGWYICIAQ